MMRRKPPKVALHPVTPQDEKQKKKGPEIHAESDPFDTSNSSSSESVKPESETKPEATETESKVESVKTEAKPETEVSVQAEKKPTEEKAASIDPTTNAESKPSSESKSTASGNLEFDSDWDVKVSAKVNVINMLSSYPPLWFNIFSQKHEKNILSSKATIAQLKEKAFDDGVSELNAKVHQKLKEILVTFPPENSKGEYSRKINFCIQRIERDYADELRNYEEKLKTAAPTPALMG